jgi:hypothetical protein
MGNETVSISFPEVMLSVATGQSATEHRVPPADGDIFLRVR